MTGETRKTARSTAGKLPERFREEDPLNNEKSNMDSSKNKLKLKVAPKKEIKKSETEMSNTTRSSAGTPIAATAEPPKTKLVLKLHDATAEDASDSDSTITEDVEGMSVGGKTGEVVEAVLKKNRKYKKRTKDKGKGVVKDARVDDTILMPPPPLPTTNVSSPHRPISQGAATRSSSASNTHYAATAARLPSPSTSNIAQQTPLDYDHHSKSPKTPEGYNLPFLNTNTDMVVFEGAYFTEADMISGFATGANNEFHHLTPSTLLILITTLSIYLTTSGTLQFLQFSPQELKAYKSILLSEKRREIQEEIILRECEVRMQEVRMLGFKENDWECQMIGEKALRDVRELGMPLGECVSLSEVERGVGFLRSRVVGSERLDFIVGLLGEWVGGAVGGGVERPLP